MPDFSLQPFRPELGPRPQTQPRVPTGRQAPSAPETPELGSGQPRELSFRDSMRNFIHDVDQVQKDAGTKIEDFMAGEISDVHDVMVAVEKAQTSFQLLMELRNKMLDAYQEIKRMTV